MLLQAAAAILAESGTMSAEQAAEVRRLVDEANRLAAQRRTEKLSLPRLPTLLLPKSDMFDLYAQQPDVFKDHTGFSPAEFMELHADVLDVLELPRNLSGFFTAEENAERRKRRYKYSSRERLFFFVHYLREYRTFRKQNATNVLAVAACKDDYDWLRLNLVHHPLLTSEISWPSDAERLKINRLLRDTGLLGPGFETLIGMADGTKDESKRMRNYAAQERDYSGNKGHGKSHMVVTDLFGKLIYIEAGLQGNNNDRGAWKLTQIFLHPRKYLNLARRENFAMDGVFTGELHCESEEGAILPVSRATINARPPAQRRYCVEANRQQRYLRVPVEQVIGMIKHFKIVGNTKFRGSLEQQGENFMLSSYLTARMMRLRDSYPRGKRWLHVRRYRKKSEMAIWPGSCAHPEGPGEAFVDMGQPYGSLGSYIGIHLAPARLGACAPWPPTWEFCTFAPLLQGEKEEWEVALGEDLWVDPMDPDPYTHY